MWRIKTKILTKAPLLDFRWNSNLPDSTKQALFLPWTLHNLLCPITDGTPEVACRQRRAREYGSLSFDFSSMWILCGKILLFINDLEIRVCKTFYVFSKGPFGQFFLPAFSRWQYSSLSSNHITHGYWRPCVLLQNKCPKPASWVQPLFLCNMAGEVWGVEISLVILYSHGTSSSMARLNMLLK